MTVAVIGHHVIVDWLQSGNIAQNDPARAQPRFTTARLSSLGALMDYNLALADVKRKTQWYFETNRPVKALMKQLPAWSE